MHHHDLDDIVYRLEAIERKLSELGPPARRHHDCDCHGHRSHGCGCHGHARHGCGCHGHRSHGCGCSCRCGCRGHGHHHAEHGEHGHHHHHDPGGHHDPGHHGPGPRGGGDFDEKRVVDLIVGLVAEKVEQLLDRYLGASRGAEGEPAPPEASPEAGSPPAG